jgi:phage gpG-like protein
VAEFRIEVNTAGLNTWLNSRNGPAAHWLARKAIEIESAAKHNASGLFHGTYRGVFGRPSNPGADEGPGVRTGRLRNSITWVYEEEAGGLGVAVGSNVEYAGYVELGTSRMPGGYPYLRPALHAARG